MERTAKLVKQLDYIRNSKKTALDKHIKRVEYLNKLLNQDMMYVAKQAYYDEKYEVNQKISKLRGEIEKIEKSIVNIEGDISVLDAQIEEANAEGTLDSDTKLNLQREIVRLAKHNASK